MAAAAAPGAANNNSKGKCLLEITKLQEFEQIAKQCAKPGIFDYGLLRVLTRSYDTDDVPVEDFQLVEQKGGNKLQYTMQCIEMKDELAVTNTLREIHILQHFGVNKYIMSLYTAFRHRQYVAMVFPAFLPIRNHLDVRYRFKNEGGKAGTGEAKFQEPIEIEYWNQFSTTFREENYLKTLGLFNRDAVAFVVKKVAKGLNFIHSKGFVHTEVCANNVYIDLRANIKIGGFLHCKQIGSKSRKFTGDMNCLPPECFDEKLTNFVVDKSIDSWSLGLFTLELITGKRHYLKEKKCIRLAKEYLDGVRRLPTLGEMDPKTLKNGTQAYHPAIDGFLARLVTLNPKNRMSIKEVLAHPFIVEKSERREILRQWKITSKNFEAMDGSRSLYHDMWAAQGSNPSLNQEFLLNIIEAIRHVENDTFPLFSKVPDDHLCKHYVGIEASVAIPYNDANWSRDVLDISQRNIYEDEDAKEEQSKYLERDEQLSSDEEWDDIKDRRRRKARANVAEAQLKSGHPAVDKDYQRFEICFFVKKGWSAKERQIFIAMQFGRWYQRGVIHFTDLIRVVDEVEEVLQNYVLRETETPDPFNQLPEAVYFASPRREIRFHPEVMADRATRYLQHIYVDVAITKEANETKLKKFAELMEGDPIQLPDGLATYQASVCFQDLDPTQFEELEAQMLGEVKCDVWDVSEDQRQADSTNPETYLYKLLIERRRFWFSHRNDYSNEGQASNQARCEKIWGDFRRDYIFRVCKWANLPWKISKTDAELLWGNPFANKQEAQQAIRTAEDLPEEQLLAKQLARTKIKQEEDVIDQFKRVEDVELRQRAVDQHKQAFQGQEGYFKLENQLARGRGAATKKFDPLATPAAHGTRKILRKH